MQKRFSEENAGRKNRKDSEGYGKDIITVRPESDVMTKQNLPYFVGISEKTVGSRYLTLNMVVIPPGGAADAHYHDGYETAVYILEGTIKTLYGEGLKKSVINKAGDFLFIPPNVPHQPVNLDPEHAARALAARNDPNEQESVVLYEVNKKDRT